MSAKRESRNLVWMIIGILILVAAVLTPDIPGLSFAGKMSLALLVSAVILWASDCMPIPVTALGLMAIIPLFGIMSFAETWTATMNSLILFLVGAFAFTVFLEHSTVADRLVARILRWSGVNPGKILFGFIFLSGAISTIMSSNIALTTLMMTIAHSLLKAGQRKEGESNLGRCLAIAIPWAVVVGSFLTPWGNPINLMIIGIVDTTFGISIPFTTWIAMGLLPVVLILLSMWFALMKIYKPEPLPQEAVDYGIERTSELPAMTIREKLNVVVIIATIVLWIAGGWIPILNTTTVVLVALAVMFMPKIRFISFNDYIKDSPWGLILMLLSINAIIAAITVSGATNWLMENVISNVSGFSPLIIILICSLIGIVLDNLIPSGPANAGLLTVPFVGFMVASGSDVTTMAMVIAWWAGIAYLMPLSAINMVTYQGYQYYAFGDMARAGWIPMIMQLASTMLLFPLIAMLLSAP